MLREAYRAKEREKKRKQRVKKQLPKSPGKVWKDRKKMEVWLRRRLKEKYTTLPSPAQSKKSQSKKSQNTLMESHHNHRPEITLESVNLGHCFGYTKFHEFHGISVTPQEKKLGP